MRMGCGHGMLAARLSAVMPACAGMAARGGVRSADYPANPAAIFTLIAMMNTLKKNAITLCSNATRRR